MKDVSIIEQGLEELFVRGLVKAGSNWTDVREGLPILHEHGEDGDVFKQSDYVIVADMFGVSIISAYWDGKDWYEYGRSQPREARVEYWRYFPEIPPIYRDVEVS